MKYAHISVLLFAAACTTFAAEPARADFPATGPVTGCVLKVNNPHLSATAGAGIDAKSTMTCDAGYGKSEVNPSLYRCDVGHGDTVPSENWIFDNCDLVAWNFTAHAPSVAGKLYTAQAPKPGSGTYVHGSGWYVQDTVFYTQNPGVGYATGKSSRVVYIAE